MKNYIVSLFSIYILFYNNYQCCCNGAEICVVSSECPTDKACINQKCRDPCPGTCGINANCIRINHNPICSCLPGYTGDPFDRCSLPCSRPNDCSNAENCLSSICKNPCSMGNDCGAGAICYGVDHQPFCSCPTDKTGNPRIKCVPLY